MDDAGGGRRGRRALWNTDVDDLLRSAWGLWPVGENADLGGSTSLNLLVTDGSAHFVARIHRPSVTSARLGAIQDVRRYLHRRGVPCTEPVPTLWGKPFAVHEDRLVEAEPFIDAPDRMNTLGRVSSGVLTLGRIHADLLALALNSAAAEATFANYVPATGLRELVRVGSDRVRSWQPTPDEARLADEADELAERVAGLGAAIPVEHVQLVHGDFWDNNVLLRDGDVVLVTDLDFLGPRPRVDDLALTLYFASVDIEDLTTSPNMLATMIERYETGLGSLLSEGERAALPIAMARQPLWSLAVWVAHLDSDRAARRHLAAVGRELDWARRLVTRVPGLQDFLINTPTGSGALPTWRCGTPPIARS